MEDSLLSHSKSPTTLEDQPPPGVLKEHVVYGPANKDLLSSFKEPEPEPELKQDTPRANEVNRNLLIGPSLSLENKLEPGNIGKDYRSRKCLKKSRTAPAMTVEYSKRTGLERPRLESSSHIVKQAAFGVVIYLTLGVTIYSWKGDEFSGSTTVTFIDALYFSIVTMCTIGYGDITPVSSATKLYCCIFVLVGFGVIDILLSGMVAYILERQESLLIGAVEDGHHETARHYLVNTKEGRMRKRTKVLLALVVVVSCLAFGTAAVHRLEKLNWIDSFYLSCMSVTTVGYGDHAFKSLSGRLFASIWLLVSSMAVARAFLFLAEARIYRRSRLIAKWVLKRGMTVGDLVAADIDNDGYVSKSEYVVFKLKELGMISADEITEVCGQFNVLDTDHSGRITLSCLSNAV